MDATRSNTNKALWLSSYQEPLTITTLPIPEATAGSVVIRVLAAGIVPYTHLVHTGKLPQLNISLPLVPNPNAVGRVFAVGPDAVNVKPGDLVYADATVRARDDPGVMIMSGHHGGEDVKSHEFMQGEWRDGSLQQFQKVPLENVYQLNEDQLVNTLGYSPAILHTLAHYSVAGGAIMEAADVKVAETVIIGPSGGSFGGLAVELALTLGADVIALGRSEKKMLAMKRKLKNPPHLTYIVMTGNTDADAEAILKATPNGTGADVYNDWTPGELASPPFLAAAVRAMKRQGRVVLSGGSPGTIDIPYAFMVHKDLKVMGKWMCSRKTLVQLIRMVEMGQLQIGTETGTELAVYSLKEHEKAVKHAAEHGGWRNYTVITPNDE